MKAYPIFPWQDDRYNKGVTINQRMCHIMNKIYLALGLVSILLLAACSPQPLQTFGTDKYYVKVNQDGDVDEHGRFHYVIDGADKDGRSEEHTSELQSRFHLVCRLLLEKQ